MHKYSNVFIFFITLSLLFTVFVDLTHAQEETPEPDPSPTATPAAKVKYDLAYPGMLPDHPLYKLKQVRDKVVDALITDPRRKVDFYLLQADKGVLAAAMLVDQKKFDLAQHTLLRAEHNMTLLNTQFTRMPKKPDDAVFTKIRNASRKHQEIITLLVGRVPKDKQKTFQTVLDFSKSNLTTLERYQKTHEKRWNQLN